MKKRIGAFILFLAGTAGVTPLFAQTPTPTPYIARIDVGGFFNVNEPCKTWVADQNYTPGSFGCVGSPLWVDGGCNPPGLDPSLYSLYDTIRYYGDFHYKFDVPQAGTYHTTLYFTECFHNYGESRVFQIWIQGTKVDEFNLVPLCVAPDGTRTLINKSFDVDLLPSNLTLDIEFIAVTDNALVSAIEVQQNNYVNLTCTPTPTFTPTITYTPTTTPTPTITATPTSTSTPTPPYSGDVYIYPAPARGNQAKVCYQMTESGKVNLKVWNDRAELVDKVAESKPSGVQVTPFNISGFASGVYFYSLTLTYDSGKIETIKPHKFVVIH